MKRVIAITTVVVGTLLLVLGTWGLSRGHGYGSWGQKGIVSFLIEHKEELRLTESQVSALESIRKNFYEQTDPLKKEIQKARQGLRELMKADEIDVATASGYVSQITGLRAEWWNLFVRTIADVKKVLDLEQRQKARELRSQTK